MQAHGLAELQGWCVSENSKNQAELRMLAEDARSHYACHRAVAEDGRLPRTREQLRNSANYLMPRTETAPLLPQQEQAVGGPAVAADHWHSAGWGP